MKSVEKVVPFVRPKKRPDSDDSEFLPAALEIVETPASPIGRSIAYMLMALFALAVIWACIGKVDIVATAKGKIVPSGRVKVVQPFATGVVRAIAVHDGQTVKAGQTLIELDPTIDNAASEHYRGDLMVARLDVARLRAELSPGDALGNFKPPGDAPPGLVAVERQFLMDQVAEQRAKLAVLDRQQQQKGDEQDAAAATISKLEASLPILKQRVDIRQTLYKHMTGSLASYLELLQPYVEEQHELDVEKHHLAAASAAIAAVKEQRVEAIAEFRRARYADLVEAERKVKGLGTEVVSAERRAALEVLKAPVDGTVQQLAVHTIGGVVTPAQPLLVLVPTDSPIEIEADVLNRDIGFVHAGQDAEVKVDAFDFNRYGLIHGVVTSLSPDSIALQKPPGGANSGGGGLDESSGSAGQQLIYSARVALDRTRMNINGKLVHLEPGMAVTVEIKTGRRRIISYLLSPLMSFQEDAMHER